MPKDRGSAIIEQTVDPTRSSIRTGKRSGSPRVRLPTLDLALTLDLLEADSEYLGARADRLLAGHEYVAVVRIRPPVSPCDDSALESERYTLRGEALALELRCSAIAVTIDAIIDRDSGQVEGASGKASICIDRLALAQEQEIQFEVYVPETCDRAQVVLNVFCGVHPTRVLALELPLVARARPMLPHELPAFAIRANTRVPGRMAFLHVSQGSNEAISLLGRHTRDRLDEECTLPSELSLAKAMSRVLKRKGHDLVREAGNTVDTLREFSRKRLELRRWLSALFTDPSETPILVINDQSNAEIPWEMLEFEDSCLGARVEVVRWMRVSGRNGRVQLDLQERCIRGGVANFVHSASANPGTAENLELKKLTPTPLRSMNEVLRHVDGREDPREDGDVPLALLYVATHGQFSTPRPAAGGYVLAGAHSEAFPERMVERLRSRKERSLVVFVNACESGRLLRNGPWNSDDLTGLAERFLARVAVGYVGTLCEVTNDHAAEIGAQILSRLADQEPDCRLPRILREIRERAVSSKRNGDGEQDWVRFLHAFSYVYYGEPLASMQVETRTFGCGRAGR